MKRSMQDSVNHSSKKKSSRRRRSSFKKEKSPQGTSHLPSSKPRGQRPDRRDRVARAARSDRFGGKHELSVYRAIVEKHKKGFAFLVFEAKARPDLFVSPQQADGLFHGDRVEVKLKKDKWIVDLRVLEHRFQELVGKWVRAHWVVYERKHVRHEVYVPQASGDVKIGDWVKVRLHFHQQGRHRLTGEILSHFGSVLPAAADIEVISSEFNLKEDHPDSVVAEASFLRLDLEPKSLVHRQDLRKIPFITIDGETARDFDDAVYVERKKSGYLLWVAIADVSHYVTEASLLDQEARARGTSVYFPERAFHMLPGALSENLCSLKPHEPRFALVARIEFDHQGRRKQTSVVEAIIESQRRATYTEIQQEWEQHQKDRHWSFRAHFELYLLLRAARTQRGSIDFELPEAQIDLDEQCNVQAIQNRSRLDSHRLIEEFMIVANESVTEWMMKKKWPFVYRTHDGPSFESLERFQRLAKNVGFHFKVDESINPGVLADFIRRIDGHPAQAMLNMALLRSMKQAIYSPTHGIHFGLASQAYTHFTSPIRRYPDLVVHRLIRLALSFDRQKQRLKDSQRKKLEQELADICTHCSSRERLAAEAEREMIRIKQVRLMRNYLGHEFVGKVIGMTGSGFFVQMNDPFVEGMVSVDSLQDDEYEFFEDKMTLRGRRHKKSFRIGDVVRVKVVRADLEQRQIDFILI